jgi:hypothetical protein
VIASVVFGVIVGLVAAQLGTTELVAVGGGMAGTAIGIALMLRYGVREYRKFVARMTTINDERSGQES